MSDKKLVPKLRFNGFEDDEWHEVKIEDKFDKVRNGFVGVATPYYVEKGIPYLQSNNIRRNKIDKTQMVYINKEFHEKHEKSMLKENDILVVQSGHAGECTVVPKEFEGCNCHALIIMSPNDVASINSTFCAYYLNSPVGIKKLFPLITGNTIKHILASEMKKLRINLPSLNEQNKLSHFLSIIDKKIDLLENKLQEYMDFKKYLMQQIFAQKLRFDFDDKWKNIPFKKLLKEINEKTTVNNQHEILSSTKEGIFTQKEYFADRNVASKDNTGYKILRKNQIVLSPQNLWMGNINVNTEFDIGIVSPSYKIYETTDLVDINYFKHIIKLPRLIYEYTCASEQGASIVRRNLNKELFNEITIKVPSPKEQEKIGKLFDVYDEKIKNIDKNIQDMKEFKKGLLQQMFV